MGFMGGLKDMTSSERGLYALAVLACATVLMGLGRISSELWAGVALGGQGIHAWAKTARPSGTSKADSKVLPPKKPEDNRE